MKDFFCVPRRYNFQIPVLNETEMNGITKSAQLNLTIKKLLAIAMSPAGNNAENANVQTSEQSNADSITNI